MDLDLMEDSILLDDDCNLNDLNFLGIIACSVRQTFKEELEKAVIEHRDKKNIKLKGYVPSGCSCKADLSSIWDAKNIDDFPDVAAANGFKDEFRNGFMNDLVDKGHFKYFRDEKNINKEFLEAGCIDPKGVYNMYGVSPSVILVDKKKLGDLPMPKNWGDLLDPVYKDNIIVGGTSEELSDSAVLYIYKEYGENGVKKLVKNTKSLWHPSKMSKTAGTMNQEGAAIYVMSWFFAKTCPNAEKVAIVWPEDGALINPMCMIAKESKVSEMDTLINFVMGEDLGSKLADSYFPSLNSKVDNKLPENAKFKWLGWDYIRENDMEEVRNTTNTMFIKEWHNK
ncbi:Fe3+ ABC transporter periplasmic protein [Clostridium pasteurianum DSM 525 = ATCC 6013]|uniref:Fe3+ ABC transporter periplasmic protein n=1 Tax=Clostridium pasteurianum DSM 525 = ATCC 6013 TaxID=1262449 RepID=A0A0H3J910_CLOPA|nr:ABC transporter substrate-binding protein [Clostridium pasteurianum]AJA49989.1 Fe3+ ABC transporter periplasmic protein [Clostridium pasteurianum DSM 525 = ATCC 6013]AJA53977.1 Fe3+ ABC transporter periplasmic protein [Clostridium pasteurianum DSM 525 = ATCC 6013]AOZ77120.1 iron ABC transporter substrate-binding protein [Clostridium pasteurianum DSM 525 = ATCC 6013]AOZ80917.1 iron ABC transporter substrate-binding protein [Clostridium pasteurianum]ELP59301.1 Fe3+ ABC transporter periplasmic